MRTFSEIQVDVNHASSINDAEALLLYAVELDSISAPQAEALANNSRGLALYIQGDRPAALSHYHSALALYEELGDRGGVAAVSSRIGVVNNRIGNYTEALSHFHLALAILHELDDRKGVAGVTGNIGTLHWRTGNYPEALSHYHRALALSEELGDLRLFASTTGNIGIVHWNTGDFPTALTYLHRALELHEELGDRGNVARVTANIGNVYGNIGDNPSALSHYHRALALHEELGNRSGMALVMCCIGIVHSDTGDYPAALSHYHRALALHEELGERNNVTIVTDNILSVYVQMGSDSEAQHLLTTMNELHPGEPRSRIQRAVNRATLLERSGNLDAAAATLQLALSEAHEHGLRSLTTSVHKALRDLAQKRNDFAGYIEHNNEFTRITEEINGKDTATKLAIQAKQREIDAERKETDKHMAVLHSTLPKHIADRVARGEVVNDHFENASVLFVDVVGFTTHSSELDATVVVELLQNIFSSFDGICAKHDVTKIKTIGDSYMAVAFDIADAVGARPRLAREQTDIPNVMPSEVEAQQIANSEQRIANQIANSEQRIANQIANSEQRIANVAQAMMSSVFMWPHTGERVMFRIGIHCGPVVAGVLGTQRMQYDVWGDTVNVASRMESTSESGKIHISEALANALNEHKNSPPSPLSHASLERGSYTVVPRGTVDVKGKGLMQTYWLSEAL
ncbi:MAG: tetratricopeptide repeat protein [Ignavibacteria bacterium]|nr:tetratricopeptide repeat protein [Ignavibacteria bacterium]